MVQVLDDAALVVELRLLPFRLVLEDNPERAVEIRLHVQPLLDALGVEIGFLEDLGVGAEGD